MWPALVLALVPQQDSTVDPGPARSPVVLAMRALHDRHREAGQSAATRTALRDFWSEHDAEHAEDPEYLLEKWELLGWLDEDEEAARVFERVPDAALTRPIHLFNRLQQRVETDLGSVAPLLARLARLDEPRAARWVHDGYAQRFAPVPRPGLDLAAHVALLEELGRDGSPAAGLLGGLRDWLRALACGADARCLRELLERELPAARDEHLTRAERYRLLLVARARLEPTLASLAERALRASVQRLRLRAAAEGPEIDRAQRARDRYLLAHAAWMLAHATPAPARAERLEWLRLAARAGPGAQEQDLGAVWFYERACLGGLEEYRSPVARELEALGDDGAALEVWLEVARVQPRRRAEARAAFARLAPDEDFETRWLEFLERHLPSVPELRLVTPTGEPISPGELRGKWVLLEFWGTWCGPCRAELPRLEALHQDLRAAPSARAALLTVACHDSPGTVARFLAEHDYSFPVVLGDAELEQAFAVTTFPTKLLITPGGRWMELPGGPDWESVAREYLLPGSR